MLRASSKTPDNIYADLVSGRRSGKQNISYGEQF